MIAILLSIFMVAALWAVVILLKLPIALAVAVTAAVALVWIGFLALRIWRARKAAGEIDKALEAGAEAQARSARPDQQDEIAAMQAEFQKALSALKGSKLARGGRNALAVLPWYLMIGPPGGGKTRALLGSELKFPYLSKRGGVRGMGGTRNCEWFLSNEAVLLDTAGRFTTEDEDHDEWMAFLEMLRKARPKKPVNGVILAVPFTDVIALSEEAAAELGQRMRERVDEVMTRLRLVLPVYVIFTKCDLLPGFVETFANLRKGERGQVWGFTIPMAKAGDKAAAFSEGFDEILAVVEERSLVRLGEEHRLLPRERIYEFPQQLGAGKAMLGAFIEALFDENVYQEAPILRGVYLTSGTQEGRVVDRVMTKLVDAYGIRASLPPVEPVTETKSYFLRDVFAHVMFPDQGIAFRDPRAARREELRRWIAAGAVGLCAAIALGLVARSFFLNRDLVQSTDGIVRSTAERLHMTGKGPSPLAALEPLRERYLLLDGWERDGAPWAMRFGLYRGSALLPDVRRFYAVSVGRLLLDAEFKSAVEDLEAFVRRFEAIRTAPSGDDYGRCYEILKLHLLLTKPRAGGEPAIGEVEREWIGRAVAQRWASRPGAMGDPVAAEVVQKHAEVFAKVLSGDPRLAFPRYQELVRRTRRVLSRLPLSTLGVQKLVAELEGKGYDVTLETVLRNAPVPALRAGAHVRGAFTRRAYEEVVKDRLSDPASLVELWVVADDGAEGRKRAEGEAEQLKSKYYSQYEEEWRGFVQSITVGEGQQPLPALQDLTHGVPTPHALLFRSVGYNTRIAEKGIVEGWRERGRRKIEELTGKAGAVLPRPAEREDPRVGPADVERYFAPFAAFGYAPDEGEAQAGGGAAAPPSKLALDDYQAQLTIVRDALQAKADRSSAPDLIERAKGARARIQELVNGQDVSWRPVLQSLLLPPVDAALAVIDDTDDVIAGQWCASVVAPYRANLDRRYPFARDGEDASLLDVGEFFKPGTGTLWSFYEKALKGAVPQTAEGFDGVAAPGGARGLRPELGPYLGRALGVTRALFPTGAAEPRVAFSVQVNPAPGIHLITLTVNGQSYSYLNGPPEWHSFVWPGDGKAKGASLYLRAVDGRDQTISREGEWGLFRLVESGTLRGDARPGRFAVAFKVANVGTTIAIDFRMDQGTAPFVGGGASPRLLEPLRAAAPIPAEIGKKGGACK